MSFAIIETGGKQYKVSASKILEIEKLNAKVGETVKFKNVLLLNDDKTTEIGSPSISGATVEAKLIDNVKDRTVLIFHKRRRKHSRKKNGHRQRHSKIQITKILSKDEYLEYKDISNKPSFLSKRFAAKEALSKALGVGLYRKGIYPKYISVKHDDFGKPFLSLSSELETIINNHNMKIQLSITDSDTQSIAFVVIES